MKLESDRFANNQWPDDEFKREIEVVKEERRLRTEDQPRALLGEQQNAATFIASPYHRPVVGWMSDLDAMTPDDVREFHKRWYVPANAVLVVAGDVDVAQVRAMAEKYYGRIPARRPGAQAARRAGAARHPPHRVQGPGRAGLRVAGLPRAATRQHRRRQQRRLGAGGAVGRARRLQRARGWTARSRKAPTAWPIRPARTRASSAAARSSSCSTACPPRARAPRWSKRRCAPRWRALPRKAWARPNWPA
jgi:hypothetical protein